MGKCQLGTKFFVCYIRVAVISEAVIKGEINIAVAWKNLGPQDLVCYILVTVVSVDVTTGYYCTWNHYLVASSPAPAVLSYGMGGLLRGKKHNHRENST